MKIVKLMGGLGNQLFQYAFGQALGPDTHYDVSWFDDVKHVAHATQRQYELDSFCIDPKIATCEEVASCLDEVRIKSRWPKLVRSCFNIPKYKVSSNRKEECPINVFNPEYLACEEPAYFEGYFQTERYFLHLRPQLLTSLKPKKDVGNENQAILRCIRSTNSVSVHVRRGDYLALSDVFFTLGLDYYRHAMEMIKVQQENPHFFIFSDDAGWIRENFSESPDITIVDNNSSDDACFDLELMSACKHNIIANSSFSWWGAWLNENPEKMVIAPTKWHQENQNGEWDILPEQWLKLPS